MWDTLSLNFPFILNSRTYWLVCDRCIELFSVDKGRCHSIQLQIWSRGGWEKDIGAASKITAIEGIIKGLIRRSEVIKGDDSAELREILARLQAEKGEEILEKKTKGSGLHSLSLGDSMQSENTEDGDVDPDCKDALGRTALMYAAHNNQFDIVKTLLEKGARINEQNNLGWTALMFAAHRNADPSIVNELIANGADVNITDQDGRTALFYAAHNSNAQIVKLLIDNDAQFDLCDNFKQTPLIVAVAEGADEVVALLLQKGADPNTIDSNIMTPLMYAAREDYANLLTLLISSGADLDKKGYNGMTALMYAAHNGNVDSIKVLLDNRASLYLRDRDGNTALTLAELKGQEDIVNILKNLYMKNKCYNHPDRIALSFCHSCGRYFCEECLVEGIEYYYCKAPECQAGERLLSSDLEDLCAPILPVDPEPAKRRDKFTSCDSGHLVWDRYSRLDDPASKSEAESLIKYIEKENILVVLPQFDLMYVAKASALVALSRFSEAEVVIREGLQKCKVRSSLCMAFGEIKWMMFETVSMGWFMQACLIGYESWKPYLILSEAALNVGLKELSLRLLNAADLLNYHMIRFKEGSPWAIRTTAICQKDSLRIYSALKKFQRFADSFLPPVDFFPDPNCDNLDRNAEVIICSNFPSEEKKKLVSSASRDWNSR
jgi:ankyrin repeat protein